MTIETDLWAPAPSSLVLHANGAGRRRILLHGFAGTGPGMRPLIDGGLAGRVIAPDLIGHGASPAPEGVNAYRVAAQIDQLDRALAGIEAFDLIGYSMGARLALSFAIARPARVRRLVLLSGRAGIDDPAARAARIEADEALADRIEADGVEAFATRWATLPIFASQSPALRAVQHPIRRRHTARGLAHSLRGFGAGAMPPLRDRLSSLPMPVSLLTGALDPKFVALGIELAALIPVVERRVIPGVGHAMHLEAPTLTASLINAFLRRPFP